MKIHFSFNWRLFKPMKSLNLVALLIIFVLIQPFKANAQCAAIKAYSSSGTGNLTPNDYTALPDSDVLLDGTFLNLSLNGAFYEFPTFTSATPVIMRYQNYCSSVFGTCTPLSSKAYKTGVKDASGNIVWDGGNNVAIIGTGTSGSDDVILTMPANRNVIYIFPGQGVSYPFFVDALVWECPTCSAPVFVSRAVSATCNGTTPNNNAQIVASNITNGSKYGYSVGSSYIGSSFTSATSFTGNTFTISGLSNPASAQTYVVRVFCDATTFTDRTVTLSPKSCLQADLSLTVTPLSQTKNAGEYAQFQCTVTNSGPSDAHNVEIRVPTTGGQVTLTGVTVSQGNYSGATNIWQVGNIANGANATLTYTVKMN